MSGERRSDRWAERVAAVALLSYAAAFTLWFAAIWAHGPDMVHRLAGSGVLAFVVGMALAIAAFSLAK